MSKDDKSKNSIEIKLATLTGKIITLNEHPEMVQAHKNSKLSIEIAEHISANSKVINLYEKFTTRPPKAYEVRNMIREITQSLLFYNIASIRENKKNNKCNLDFEKRLRSITEPLELAKKNLNSLIRQEKSDLNMVFDSRCIDSSVISEMIDACDSLIRFNKAQTKYYIPIKRAFFTFQSCLINIEDSIPVGLNRSLKRKFSQQNWELFEKLIPIICFEIFSTLDKIPDSLNDTIKGLKPSLDKIKEVEAHFFTPDFPD